MAHNKRIIHFFGLRRGGQHAIIDWIANHHHSNGGIVAVANSLQSFPPKTMKITHVYHTSPERKQEIRENPHDHDRELLICTYEDSPKYREWDWRFMRHQLDRSDYHLEFGRSDITDMVFTVRSAYNCAASRMRFNRNSPAYHEDFATWWQKMAYTALWSDRCILFDEWLTSRSHRERFSKLLCPDGDMNFADNCASFNVAGREYGIPSSSFEKSDLHRRNLFSRWESYSQDPRMIALTLDPRVKKLNSELFGWYLDVQGDTCVRIEA